MRLTFWKADKGYENVLAPLIVAGAAAHGDEIVVRPLEEYRQPEGDGGIICGVVKREVLWDHQAKKFPLLYMDKGYHRERRNFKGHNIPAWWRLCWQADHPTAYLMSKDRSPDRWDMLKLSLDDRYRTAPESGHLVLLGSSAKFHETMHLPNPTSWAEVVVGQMHEHSWRKIIYRPKPSWSDAVMIRGATFEHGGKVPVQRTLTGAFASVTYGSIACVDSILAGVPCIVLGNGVARPICSTDIVHVKDPYWAPIAVREKWVSNLCYSHFTPAEIEAGFAWKTLKGQMSYAF